MLDSHLDCVNSTAFPATCAFMGSNPDNRAQSEVNEHIGLLSQAESESVNRCGVCSAFRAIGSDRHHPLSRFGRQRLSCYVGFAYLRILRLSIQTNIDGFQQQRQSPRLRPKLPV